MLDIFSYCIIHHLLFQAWKDHPHRKKKEKPFMKYINDKMCCIGFLVWIIIFNVMLCCAVKDTFLMSRCLFHLLYTHIWIYTVIGSSGTFGSGSRMTPSVYHPEMRSTRDKRQANTINNSIYSLNNQSWGDGSSGLCSQLDVWARARGWWCESVLWTLTVRPRSLLLLPQAEENRRRRPVGCIHAHA